MKKKFNCAGFSILEATLALGVVSIGLLGVFSLSLQTARAQYINKSYLAASMLAQEGLELVRNVRDNNFLRADQGYDWGYGQGANSGTDIIQDGSYTIDYDLAINSAPNDFNSDLTRLYIDSGRYTHQPTASSRTTPYRRLIYVSDYHPDYIELRSVVSWTERGQIHSYEAVTNLYNWW